MTEDSAVWLYDPLGSVIGLSSLLTGIGCRVVSQPEPGSRHPLQQSRPSLQPVDWTGCFTR